MYLKQFFLPALGHASYLVGSDETGEALVLDARRDVDAYFDAARAKGMRIRYALDSHQHNDYVSGISEIAGRGETALLAAARAELGYRAEPLEDGRRLRMGEVEFEVLHTPGHTPEHVSLLIRDRSRGEEPAVLLSGGALLVGDVARPDLLGGREEAEKHARTFCRTLREKILTLPDHVEVYPTHVAGSLCGGSIGNRLSTTIGYERRLNQTLARLSGEQDFVRECINLDNLPAVPPYWPRMRKLNVQGPPLLGRLPEPPALKPADFDNLREQGAVVVDTRLPEAYSAHITGALNVPDNDAFPTWAGTVLPVDRPLILVLDGPADLWPLTWQLLRIGYEPPAGWLAGGMQGWRSAGMDIEMLPQWTVDQLHEAIQKGSELMVLDVRQPKEWAAGHIEGATFITGARLPERLGELPRDRPVATICSSGMRSSVAASLLRANGCREVYNTLGGMGAWKQRGLPVTED